MQANLLVVDDDSAILSSVKRLLIQEKYRVSTATSPTEALHYLQSNEVSVVLSDYRMPEMSGAVFLEHVALRYPYIVRMMLSGCSEFEIIKNAVNRGGIFYYISKPWDDDHLVTAIRLAFIEAHRVCASRIVNT